MYRSTRAATVSGLVRALRASILGYGTGAVLADRRARLAPRVSGGPGMDAARLGAFQVSHNGRLPMVPGMANKTGATRLPEFPVDRLRLHQDVPLAGRAVMVHQAEAWPTGTYCRNDRAPHPCRLARWGRGVLAAAGWSEERIAELVRLAGTGETPDLSPLNHPQGSR